MQLIKTITALTLLSFSIHTHATTDLEQGIEAQNKGDISSAASYFEAASLSGSSEAQYQLGLLYAEGIGIEKNLPKAIALMQQAANTEHLLAIQWLAQHNTPAATSEEIEEEEDPEDDC